MDIFQTNTAMDRKVINSLLTLFNQRIAKQFPGQLFRLSSDLFHCLIHRHSSYRHRAITDNPFAGFMNILARRKIHQCISSPLTAPDRLLDFLFDCRSRRRITDIGVDLDEEFRADNHRFGFGMVDIGRQYRTTDRNLLSYKLRCNV